MELKDWGLSQLGEDIWKNKYQYEGESFDEWLDRVSAGDEDLKELIDFMKSINCNDIWLHHGSKEAKENLKFQAEEAFLFSNMTKKIKIIDKKNNQIIL